MTTPGGKSTVVMRPRNPLIIAVMAVIIGAQFVVGPDAWFKSTSYDLPFSFIPRHGWGALFMVSAAIVIAFQWWATATTRLLAYSQIMVPFLLWTVCSWLSIFQGTSAGYTGPVLWSGLCAVYGNTIARAGSGVNASGVTP